MPSSPEGRLEDKEHIQQGLDSIVDGLRSRLDELEAELEAEYAALIGMPHRPGMLRLAANPLVLRMLLEERFRNRVQILALKQLVPGGEMEARA